MNNSVRIFYCGIPLGAEMLRLHGHPPVLLALGPPGSPGAARMRRRLPGSEIFEDPDLLAPEIGRAVERTRPDALISFFWPRKIPPEILRSVPRGAFGTHPSLLPAWPGPDPYFWTIRSGVALSGVTLHRVEEEYDAGAVIAQREVPIPREMDAWGLARALDRPAIELLRWCADALCSGESLAGTPQTPFTTDWARTPRARDLRIDWHQPAEVVLRLVRAAAPEPGARALFGEVPVEVARATLETERPPPGLRPAEAWRAKRGWAVRCGVGAVRLLETRNVLGHKIEPEQVFLGPDN